MTRKLHTVLLIDDSEADNFIHARRIRKAGVAEEIVIKHNGREGIDYLRQTNPDGSHPQPEIVFLDINMPVMNGWEFLQEYAQLPEHQKAGTVVTMLTTSVADTDRKRAAEYDDVVRYIEKPLTGDKLTEIISEFYPDVLG